MSNILFKTFYKPYVDQIISRIHHCINESQSNLYVNFDGIYQSIIQLFHIACGRTIMIEFRVLDETNRLSGESLEEKIAYYEEKLLGNEAYRKELFFIYPELSVVCEQIKEQQINRFIEFWNRFCFDRHLIEADLLEKEEIKYICDIDWGKGDLHCRGKGVISLTFDNGKKVFYKPHSIAGDKIFYKLLDEIELSRGMKKNKYMQVYRFISRDNYGWVKAIDFCPCTSAKEYRNFYQRIGEIIGICYFFGCHDLHYQNLIAHGEYPILIDLENMFQTDKKVFRVGEECKIQYSILSSGLLPGSMQECKFAALTGGNGEKAECEVPIICTGTNSITVNYGIPSLESGLNLPGIDVKFSDYLYEIRVGIQIAYSYISNLDIDKFSEIGVNNIRSRYLLKKTQVYFNTLLASFHPTIMKQLNGREKFIRKMCTKGKLVEDEVRDLINGDIPYFYRDATSKSLYSSDGKENEKYFTETVMEALAYRKKNMDENDLQIQLRLLEMSAQISLMTKENLVNDKKIHIGSDSKKIEKGWYEIASNISNCIVDRAIWSKHKDKVTWLTLRHIGQNEQNVAIGICDYYLYDGLPGIHIFLNLMNQEKYNELCNAIENELFSYTDSIICELRKPETEYTGALCGESSIVLSYQILYYLTKKEKYLWYAAKHIDIVMKFVENDVKYDFTYGNAGALWVLCNMYDLCKDKRYIEYAKKVELILRRHMKRNEKGCFWPILGMRAPYTGAAHGSCGFILGYEKLCELVKEENEYRQIMGSIVKYEMSHDNIVLNHNNNITLESWCHGNVGKIVTMFGYWTRHLTSDKGLEEVKKCIEETIKKLNLRKSFCLCHGNVGNMVLIQYVLSYMKYENTFFTEFCNTVRGLIESEEWCCIIKVDTLFSRIC